MPSRDNSVVLAPSIMCANLMALGSALEMLAENGIDWLHVDIMDGVFAPGFTFGADFAKQLRRAWPHRFDIHLMSDRPLDYLALFLDSGADLISLHAEHPEAVRAGIPKTQIGRGRGRNCLFALDTLPAIRRLSR